MKRILKIALPIVLGFFLVWYSLSKVSISELLEHAKNANYWWILLGMTAGLLSHMSRAYRWNYLLNPLGYNIKFANSFMSVFAAYLINYTIPRAGEVARATIITNYEQVPFEKGFGTIVAERVADTLVMLLIIGITLLIQFDFIYTFFAEKFNIQTLAISMLVLVIIIGVGYRVLKTGNSPLLIKIKDFIKGLVEGFTSIFKMKHKWAFIAHTLFIWVMYIVMFYLTTFAIKGIQPVAFGAILIGFISGAFSIAATNGGIGSYPLAIYAAFSLFGISEGTSMAFGWIMWASQTLMLIIFGGVSLLYLPIYNKAKAV